MKAYIITGTSSGIGKALCEELLKDPSNIIMGISRRQSLKHQNYKHISLDLNDLSEIEHLELPSFEKATQISLVNNAGWIGPIQKIGHQELGAIASSYLINLVAPAVLSNHFIKHYKSHSAKKVILSVSSGASQAPIEGWATYCSSKAGLEMLDACISIEHKDILNLSIAPGKVDTPMQNDVRFADEKEFPRLNEFQEYHKNGQLTPVQEVAAKYSAILDTPDKYLHIKHLSQL
jgi:benzil reductase ((S)-benzoin forming)